MGTPNKRNEKGVEPFLKWAGGKRRLLPQILPLLPSLDMGATYFEPFLGGGAVFFDQHYDNAVLSDTNELLVETYCQVRDDVDGVIESMLRLGRDQETYYAVRASNPRLPKTRAARFIYLNKNCFNGLYRVNRDGVFNVPYGLHTGRHVSCDQDQLRAAHRALQGTVLECGDFGEVASKAKAGDFVYFDPPYITAHSTNGFVEYNARVFSWTDQTRLANFAKKMTGRGVKVAVSNANHHSISALYDEDDFALNVLERPSTMAANPSKRFGTTELLIVSKN